MGLKTCIRYGNPDIKREDISRKKYQLTGSREGMARRLAKREPV